MLADRLLAALIEINPQVPQALEQEEKLGLNPDEVVFYSALANNESAVRELGDDTLKQIAVELTQLSQLPP